ncbi:MAG: DMT family transporter, partial [Pseudomonadota bacterium]
AFVWLIVVLSIGAVGLLLMMIRENAVSRVAALFYLVPAVTALIAWALFDETLSPIQGVGMAVVTIAVMLATRPAATQPAAAQR